MTNKEIESLNTINQLDLKDICRTLHPTRAKHTFFSRAHGTFSRMDHLSAHKTTSIKFKRIRIIQSSFSHHGGVKLEINYRKTFGKWTNMWKWNNLVLNNQWIKEEITERLENTLRSIKVKTQLRLMGCC